MNKWDDAIETAKNDAEIFTLLSAFYNINPDQPTIAAFKNINTDQITDTEIKEAFLKIQNFVAHAKDEEIITLKCDWTKLFRGVSPEYGPKPPYEELYGGKKSPEILMELAALYQEIGYDFGGLNNRPDYIGIQLDYIAKLFVLMAHAAMHHDQEKFDLLNVRTKSFITRFQTWFYKFKTEADKHVETDFYKGVLELNRLMVA